MATTKPAKILRPQFTSKPDLVGRMLDFIRHEQPTLDDDILAAVEQRLRAEFGGDTAYVSKRGSAPRGELVEKVRRMFNGRNATEVARRLGIARSTVYRLVKTSGVQ